MPEGNTSAGSKAVIKGVSSLEFLRPAAVSPLGLRLRRVGRLVRARNRIIAGVWDAGFASLATFAVALYAVRFLSADLLGAYALFFTAFGLAGFVSSTVYLLPTRIAAMEMEQPSRIAILPKTLLIGFLIGAFAGAFTPLTGIFALRELSVRDIAPLAITTALLVAVSPAQDHMRATFHLAGQSWRAAAVSTVQVVMILTTIIVLHTSPIVHQWVPFGALVVANSVSLLFGLVLASDIRRLPKAVMPPTQALIQSGWVLLLAGIIPAVAQLIAGAAVASFGSVKDVGYAEAARVVASPILVAAIGISQALSPTIMEAGRDSNKPLASHARKSYLLALVPLAVVYGAVMSWSSFFNPMYHLVPAAYHLGGLVTISLAAALAVSSGYVPRMELLGAQEGKQLVGPSVLGSVAHLAIVVSMVGLVGAYVIPLGVLGNNMISAAWSFMRAERLYS